MIVDDLLGSEYDNAADLTGSDFITEMSGQPKEKQADFLKKAARNKRIILVENNSRFEMEGKFFFLPKEIKDGLLKKRLQLVDTRLYVVKDISGKTSIDMFQGTDNKNVGMGNVANQKLEKDYWFSLSKIRLLFGAAGGGSLGADYSEIPTYIRNGEFELEAGGKKIVGLMSCDAFESANITNKQIGTYKLDSTKLIEPQVEIKMPVKFSLAAAATSCLKVVFIGQAVIPY